MEDVVTDVITSIGNNDVIAARNSGEMFVPSVCDTGDNVVELSHISAGPIVDVYVEDTLNDVETEMHIPKYTAQEKKKKLKKWMCKRGAKKNIDAAAIKGTWLLMKMLLEKQRLQLLKKVSLTLRVLRQQMLLCVDGAVDDNPEGGDVDVSHVDNMVTKEVNMPTIENLVEFVDPSVRDTLDGLKDGTPIGEDVMSPSVIDTVNDLDVEGSVTRSVRDSAVEGVEDMNVDISNATGTEPVTAESNCDNVVLSVTDTGAETANLPEERSMPTVGQGVADTLNVDVEKLEILEEDGTSVINTGETIIEDIFEGRVTVRSNVIDSIIVDERDMKSVEIPPLDTVLRFVDTTDIVVEENPKERETDSSNDIDVMPIINSIEKKVDNDVRPSVADLGETTIEEPVTKSMPSAADTGDETIERPSAEAMPDVIGSVVDSIDVTEVDFPNTIDVTQNQKKSKRRKHQASDENQIDVHERVAEKQMSTNVRPSVIDSWYPADDNQESEDEDVVVVTRKRRTIIGNLKIDENRTRAGNKRIHKNIIFVPVDGMIIKDDESNARWRFIYSRRIDAEEMMFEVTNKNIDIMDILEDACVMTTIETIGPFQTKLVRRVISNRNDDDSNNGKFHKREEDNIVVIEKTNIVEIGIPSVDVTTGKEKTVADHCDIMNDVNPRVGNIMSLDETTPSAEELDYVI
ncbi:hypothetical protein LIER_34126 [Lithospermum erythrorhizon]|uniref:Uncharacterized protein n=1 Tax=Lithospermum erythrorhizon TaxID=34254 RepID=A0AAV3RYK9_LITER